MSPFHWHLIKHFLLANRHCPSSLLCSHPSRHLWTQRTFLSFSFLFCRTWMTHMDSTLMGEEGWGGSIHKHKAGFAKATREKNLGWELEISNWTPAWHIPTSSVIIRTSASLSITRYTLAKGNKDSTVGTAKEEARGHQEKDVARISTKGTTRFLDLLRMGGSRDSWSLGEMLRPPPAPPAAWRPAPTPQLQEWCLEPPILSRVVPAGLTLLQLQGQDSTLAC